MHVAKAQHFTETALPMAAAVPQIEGRRYPNAKCTPNVIGIFGKSILKSKEGIAAE
jgi:hypothetical protein